MVGIDGEMDLSDKCDDASGEVEWIDVVILSQKDSAVFLSFEKKVERSFCLYSSQNLVASPRGSARPSSFD